MLLQGNIPADLGIPNGFVGDTSYVERRRDVTMTLLGKRNTLAASLFQAQRQPLGLAGSSDSLPGVAETNEHGVSVTFNHRLSGFSSIMTSTSWRRTTGDQRDAATRLATSQWDFRVDWVTQIGPKTNGRIGYRHVNFDGSNSTTSYRENAVTAGVSMTF